jgi:hypothetical protein
MHEATSPKYLPIATSHNKSMFEVMQPGYYVSIDVVCTEAPFDRQVVDAWLTVEGNGLEGPSIWYHDGPKGRATRYGHADKMKQQIAAATTVD